MHNVYASIPVAQFSGDSPTPLAATARAAIACAVFAAGDGFCSPELPALVMFLSTLTGHPQGEVIDFTDEHHPGELEDAFANLVAQACAKLPSTFTDAMVEEFSPAPSVGN